MCGRFTLRTPAQLLAQVFGLMDVPQFSIRYNIAPTQSVLAVRLDSRNQREFVTLQWGLVPGWADDPSIGNKLINARAETVPTKPSFRDAFRHRRCLIVADGFYEWEKQGKEKQPMLISHPDNRPFAFAGLWENWRKGPGEIQSCTIITTTANPFMKQVHDRMPVILKPQDYDQWLTGKLDIAEQLLGTSATDGMTMIPVSKIVNSPRNDLPQCVEPVARSSLF